MSEEMKIGWWWVKVPGGYLAYPPATYTVVHLTPREFFTDVKEVSRD